MVGSLAGTENTAASRPPSFLSDRTVHGDAETPPNGRVTKPEPYVGQQDEKGEVQEKSAGEVEVIEEYPSAVALMMIIVALMLSMFLVALDMTIVATAIPRITDQFKSLDEVGWYGSAFFLTIASFQSTWGKGYKYFPLKATFLSTIFIFELGSLICGVAQSSTTLIVGRAIQGMGAAGLASGIYTIIGFSVPPQRRPAFTGIIGAVYAVASVVGPLLGGVFTDNLSWRWCFYINLPVGGVSAAIIFFFFKAPPAAKPVQAPLKEKLLQMDLLGTFTIMAAVVCYLLALQWGGVTKPWSHRDVVGTLVGFSVLVILFIVIEWQLGDRALLQPRLFKQRNVLLSCLFIGFGVGPMFILIYYLPIYFQSIMNTSAAQSGIRNLPFILGVSLFSIVSGVLITIFGHFAYLLVLGSTLTAIGSGLIYMLDIDTSSAQWIGYQILPGIGTGIAIQIPIIVNQALVDVSDLASISAITLFVQTIGGAFWVSAGQAAFVNRLVSKLPELAPNVDPALVVTTGASELRHVFSEEDLPGVLMAYMAGLKVTFTLCIALGGVGFLITLFAKWESLKGKAKLEGAV
ncbi:hypothetical protein AJ80_07188 [Polytolypa hystricis UAMH7299]|uniref:Major facilitator superfamily (MFS) profile domain-containing protein n=1 Tax=Polytolypa hystricis (strain UAMH7299) TaxID=1447883 RepID=A0A2B7XQQ4_POLH7|nr:hypothetical protein AJ80_07188 [Polytolypa hystricis UAMH7299]